MIYCRRVSLRHLGFYRGTAPRDEVLAKRAEAGGIDIGHGWHFCRVHTTGGIGGQHPFHLFDLAVCM